MEQWQHRVSLTPETLRSHGAGSLAKGSSSAAGHITSFRNLSEPFADGFSVNEMEILTWLKR